MDVKIGTHWLQTTNILYSQLLYIQAASDLDMPLVRGGPGKKPQNTNTHTSLLLLVAAPLLTVQREESVPHWDPAVLGIVIGKYPPEIQRAVLYCRYLGSIGRELLLHLL